MMQKGLGSVNLFCEVIPVFLVFPIFPGEHMPDEKRSNIALKQHDSRGKSN